MLEPLNAAGQQAEPDRGGEAKQTQGEGRTRNSLKQIESKSIEVIVMKVLVQYPASSEIADVQLAWDETLGKFFELSSPFDHDEDSAGEVSQDEVSRDHAQAEVLARQDSMFPWMKENAAAAGLVVTPAIQLWSSTEYIEESDSFRYFSTVTVEGNTESPFIFESENHASDAREFAALISADFS